MQGDDQDRSRLTQIRAFAVVAETLSFTRAAEVLGTSQPPISRLVRRLEDRLGVVLFHRDSHSVQLTAAGEELLGPARATLTAVAAFEKTAEGIADGANGQLKIGTTDGTAQLVAQALALFSRSRPEVVVHLEQEHTPIKIKRIKEGSLDAAFVRNPRATPGVETYELARYPLSAVVSANSSLAARGSIDLIELADQPLILTPSSVNSDVRDAVLHLAMAAGFTPKLGPPLFNSADAIAQIASSAAWTLLAPGEGSLRNPEVSYIKVNDPGATVAVTLAWSSVRRSEAVTDFVRAAKQAARLL